MRATASKSRKPSTVDEYLAALPDDDKRAALQKLRRTIKAALPRAEECISYGLPAFRFDGRMLVWYGAGANHCSFYPGAIVEAHKQDLKKYETSKGTIRFQPNDPLPAPLIRKLVKACVARNEARQPTRS
jgi:uncharacterized protein YdhG (YjbR/CyaY superfamily)